MGVGSWGEGLELGTVCVKIDLRYMYNTNKDKHGRVSRVVLRCVCCLAVYTITLNGRYKTHI